MIENFDLDKVFARVHETQQVRFVKTRTVFLEKYGIPVHGFSMCYNLADADIVIVPHKKLEKIRAKIEAAGFKFIGGEQNVGDVTCIHLSRNAGHETYSFSYWANEYNSELTA